MFANSLSNPESVFYGPYRMQLMATLTVTLITFSYGVGVGWVAPMLLKLKSEDSPLPFVVTVEETSWIGGFLNIGGMSGIIVFGIMLNSLGRKICLHLLALPIMLFWITVFFTSEVYHLYIARFFIGVCGGPLLLVVPIYVSEISDPKIRGSFGSVCFFFMNIGILGGFIISSHLPYHVIPCISMVLPTLFVFLLRRFPETPTQLLRKGLVTASEDSLKFYQNYKGDTKEENLKFNSDFSQLKQAIESLTSKDNAVTIKDFCQKASLKAICLGVGMVFLNMFSGLFAILNYASMIFHETGSKIDPNLSTIIIGIVQIVASYVSIMLVDKYGRKILLLVSSSGMFIGLTTIGIISWLARNTEINVTSSVAWLPLALISLVVFSSNIGISPVTFVVLIEIQPPKIRSLGTPFFIFMLAFFSFTIVKIFPIMIANIGIYGAMWMCAGVTVFGFFFVFFFLAETKGKSLN